MHFTSCYICRQNLNLQDIVDFEDIVRMVVAGHPITPPTPGTPPAVVPRVVDMFYGLCAMLPKTTQHNNMQKLT
ncbi:hypothetical protein RHMOL_Rhmol07G0296000 [Rhododendron molle]|uniref:Uncharacterized protein n=1 Tax=Rhododendron molle TaxID=49168 RepID=A0ACC0N6C3_RHOML|nr:hypothetical protein RHMOL_Rhmol07G0296000 [Rhododendron molle]